MSGSTAHHCTRWFLTIQLLLAVSGARGQGGEAAESPWRDARWRAGLTNETLDASFQAGIPHRIVDRAQGTTLVAIDPAELPEAINLFGTSGVSLDTCVLSQEATSNEVRTTWTAGDGTVVSFRWSLDAKSGDLVLQTSATTPEPVEDFRFILFGCDIEGHSLTWANHLGVGHHIRGPRQGRLHIGDPRRDPSPGGQIQPMVALFQREGAGWAVTGREERIGPACMMMQGRGATADIGFIRRFLPPTREPQLFEIRLRTYSGDWRTAVDPYIDWMEHDVGYVPLAKRSPAWIKDIRNQAYVRVGDFDGLARLAEQVNPAQTFLGRMVGFRHHSMGTYGPDYRLTETARKWFGRARELGFHVGAHFSAYHLSPHFPDLMERFRPGFQVVGKDQDGNPIYQTLPRWKEGAPFRVYYTSHAFEPWRRYFIEQLREAVEAGVDIIYLDEAAWPCGNPYIDGMTSVEGIIALEREILETYPGVAIETEQFNPMASRHAAFALCQMSPGHPLGGYIFQRFVKVVPEGINYQATRNTDWDAVASWGHMLPGADGEPSWLEIVRAFQQYELVPDIGLPRIAIPAYESDKRHGLRPAWQDGVAAPDGKLFGYRGRDGVTAFYEKKENRRGMVVYEPGKEPHWVGARITGVTEWAGPGVLQELVHGVSREVDWFLYDDNLQHGLDPASTYRLDSTGVLPPERFHVSLLPGDFALWDPNPSWFRPQDAGRDGSYFRLTFTGNGDMAAYVPDHMLAFLDGAPLAVDRADSRARFNVSTSADQPTFKSAGADTADQLMDFEVSASTEKPALLLAFAKSDEHLEGRLADLPWQVPRLQRNFISVRHQVTDMSLQGPVPRTREVNAFYTMVSGMMVVIGKLPDAEELRLRGAYTMRKDAEGRVTRGDGVVRINGNEVVRVPAGDKPYAIQSFDVDITAFAGHYTHIEFHSDGVLMDPAGADWYEPQIVVME